MWWCWVEMCCLDLTVWKRRISMKGLEEEVISLRSVELKFIM